MTLPGDQVRTLLNVAADQLPGGPIGVPLAGLLDRTRTRRRRGRYVQLAGAFVVVLLAIGVPVAILHGRGPTTAEATTAQALPSYGVPTVGAYPTASAAGVAALARGHWTSLPAAPIVGRSDAAVAWTGRQMVVWGGTSASGDRAYADGAAYDPATREWQKLPSGPLSARSSAAVAWTGSRMFVWGGYVGAGSQQVASDGALYDPVSGTWQPVAPSPLAGRADAIAVWTGSEVVVIGGMPAVVTSTQREYLDAAAYDPATNRWRRLPTMPVQPSHTTDSVTAVATSDGIYVWSYWEHDVVTKDGGTVTSGISLARYDPTSGTWHSMDTTQPRDLGTPLWTGRELIFPAAQPFYGDVPGPYTTGRSGWRLDLPTGTFRRIPHGPVDDLGATPVWTGAALLSVDTGATTSGPAGTNYPGEAAVWDPATNAWSGLPSAPDAGAGTIATVWTGSHLLEWGLMFPSRGDSSTAASAGLSFGS